MGPGAGDFLDGFDMPVEGRITGVYGSQRILNGEPRQPHYGIDIAAPRGTPVLAPAAGRITLVRDLYFSGWTILMTHGLGLNSAFLHLDSVTVAEGDTVPRGGIIGTVGSTGRSTGPHLDWRLDWQGAGSTPRWCAGSAGGQGLNGRHHGWHGFHLRTWLCGAPAGAPPGKPGLANPRHHPHTGTACRGSRCRLAGLPVCRRRSADRSGRALHRGGRRAVDDHGDWRQRSGSRRAWRRAFRLHRMERLCLRDIGLSGPSGRLLL